jgi:lysozyme
MSERIKVAALSLSASALVVMALHEGYSPVAYEPVKGDVPTIGFGTTEGVKKGDTITPDRALVKLLKDANRFELSVKKCAPVPMYQYEFDAYVSLTYNIGPKSFCDSSIVKKLKDGDYAGACKEILRWDRFKGKPLPGLTRRRMEEYQKCLGS